MTFKLFYISVKLLFLFIMIVVYVKTQLSTYILWFDRCLLALSIFLILLRHRIHLTNQTGLFIIMREIKLQTQHLNKNKKEQKKKNPHRACLARRKSISEGRQVSAGLHLGAHLALLHGSSVRGLPSSSNGGNGGSLVRSGLSVGRDSFQSVGPRDVMERRCHAVDVCYNHVRVLHPFQRFAMLAGVLINQLRSQLRSTPRSVGCANIHQS